MAIKTMEDWTDRQTKERKEERKKERWMDGWKSLFIHGYFYQINTTVQFALPKNRASVYKLHISYLTHKATKSFNQCILLVQKPCDLNLVLKLSSNDSCFSECERAFRIFYFGEVRGSFWKKEDCNDLNQR